MKKKVNALAISAMYGGGFLFGLCSQTEVHASTEIPNKLSSLEKNYSSPEEAMNDFKIPKSQGPISRAWVETVPNIADQDRYGSNTWSGLYNVQYRTIRVPNNYNRTYNERKPSRWWPINNRTYYWQFFYRVW